jgi:hypothetical protein
VAASAVQAMQQLRPVSLALLVILLARKVVVLAGTLWALQMLHKVISIHLESHWN